MTNLDITLDSAVGTFVALMFMEALVKPIATRTGKWIIHKLDHVFPSIPDWLSDHTESEGKIDQSPLPGNRDS
jgi:hypothetical protein